MSSTLSRRQFLRSAGGITFLALAPLGRGLFGAPWIKPLAIPIFTALPYIQPGPEGRLVPGAEIVRLAWQTEQQEADFVVEFGRTEHYGQAATVSRSARDYRGKGDKQSIFNYVCSFAGLELGTEYRYRVRCNGETIATGYFTTRQPRGSRTRFVAFGDNSFGDPSDRAIAFQAYRNHPDFIMNCGDNVYDGGLDNEYSRLFFPVYNADVPGPGIGAPLLRSVPFYSVLANHDVPAMNADKTYYYADFKKDADSLAYYTNFHFPLNGPATTAYPTPMQGPDARIADFKACAGERYPRMANYSYDAGDAHFLCLDANTYTDPTDPGLQAWIDADLAATDARWKLVTMHHPPFNIGAHHGHEQHMRVLVPLFEKHGVSLVLSGHEHNYQRTRPLRFVPGDIAKAHKIQSKDRLVPGAFKLDQNFDGEKQTKPDGVIYITTGAGGKYLYDPEYNNKPEMWMLPEDGNLAYTVIMVSDRHSVTVVDVDRDELRLRQVDQHGNEIDRIRLT